MNPLMDSGLKYCSSDPAVQIYDDPAGSSLDVLKKLFTEMSGLFPDETLFDIGCDETSTDKTCSLDNLKSLEHALVEFIETDLKKTSMGWEEILFTTGAADKATVVNGWHQEGAGQITGKGYRAVESSGGHFYLNHVAVGHCWSGCGEGACVVILLFLVLCVFCFVLHCCVCLSLAYVTEFVRVWGMCILSRIHCRRRPVTVGLTSAQVSMQPTALCLLAVKRQCGPTTFVTLSRSAERRKKKAREKQCYVLLREKQVIERERKKM